ncbi:hypothetical protein [Rhodopseudomonas sp. RCAM05734]|uniref:hypothetical protein n=1 Tax=Rhodopseudomonas sp. RCAM05734 TaxID=3457549 RepID=UPI004044E1A5
MKTDEMVRADLVKRHGPAYTDDVVQFLSFNGPTTPEELARLREAICKESDVGLFAGTKRSIRGPGTSYDVFFCRGPYGSMGIDQKEVPDLLRVLDQIEAFGTYRAAN